MAGINSSFGNYGNNYNFNKPLKKVEPEQVEAGNASQAGKEERLEKKLVRLSFKQAKAADDGNRKKFDRIGEKVGDVIDELERLNPDEVYIGGAIWWKG